MCALSSLLPTEPSFLDSISEANCSASVLILKHFCGQPARVTLCGHCGPHRDLPA